MTAFDRILGAAESVGDGAAARPRRTIALALASALACSAGLRRATVETRASVLFLPRRSEAVATRDAIRALFPSEHNTATRGVGLVATRATARDDGGGGDDERNLLKVESEMMERPGYNFE